MYRCVLVKAEGQTRELETRFLGDTTIATAAGMVAQELGNRTQSDEVYFFGLQRHILSTERAYYVCSQNTTNTITPERLSAYLTNIVGFDAPKTLKAQKSYTYTDLVGLGLTGEHQLRIPLSVAVNAETQYPVAANPFDWVSHDPMVAQNAEAMIAYRGQAVLFDTLLSEPIVFCCSAEDVLGSSTDPALTANLARVYFPVMAARGIQSMAALRASHSDARTPTPPRNQNQALTILEYSDTVEDTMIGVTECTAVFHPDLPVHIPLELLFRSVPASENVPFIKFNMGRSRSRLYRLYAPVGADGSKQPYLSARRISRLQRAVSMQEGVGYAVFGSDSLCTLELSPTANLRLRFIAQHPVPIDEVGTRLNDMMGHVLTELNEVLLDTGFQFPSRFDLHDEGVEMQNVVLRGVREHVERFDPGSVVGCVSDVMYATDLGDNLAELVYHRVGYYDTMSAVEKYVTTRLRQSKAVTEVVKGVELGFGLTHAEAVQAVAGWAAKAQEELNAHANQRLRIVTSGGVDVELARDRATRRATVSAEGIIGISQARLLTRYMNALLAASCSPGAAERFQSMVGACEVGKVAQRPGMLDSSPGAAAVTAAASAPVTPTAVEDNRIVADDDDDMLDDLFELYGDMEADDDIGEAELGVLLDDGDDEKASAEAIMGARADEGSDTPVSVTPAAAAAPSRTAPAAPRGADVVGMQLSNPNYFLHRLYERDRKLFVSKQAGRFKTYSRICPSNLRRQPVVLTQAEKERMEREAPDSFDPSSKGLMLYGSGDGPPNWYMCPRYWCLKTDLPMSQAQVDAGECGGKIIPHKAKVVPEDAFIYEFYSEINQQHRAKDGSYAQHYPGFIDRSEHPEDLCIPCCFKNVDQPKVRARINMCLKGQNATEQVKTKRASRLYVKDANKFPLSAGDIGFLPPIVQKLLATDNSRCMVSQRDKTIATNVRCALRGGVGGSQARSFINAVATATDMALDQLIDKLVAAITPDTIGQWQDGTLVESLIPRLNPTPPLASQDLRAAAADRLRGMLMDPKAAVGYQYAWDLVRLHAFPQPVNLIVIVLDEVDGSDNVRLLCPAASSSDTLHDVKRGTLVLLRKKGFYEPVILYRSSAASGETPLAPIERVLGVPDTKEPQMKEAVDRLGAIASGCGGRTVEAELTPSETVVEEALARGKTGEVIGHVVNFSGQLVGLHVHLGGGQRLVVPVAATAVPDTDARVKLEMIGSARSLQLLDATLEAMKAFSTTTGLKLEPETIVEEDGLGVAILTTNDRVVPVLPSSLTGSEEGKYRGIDVVGVTKGDDPVEADRISVLGSGQDETRLAASATIKAHSGTYELFRAWLRAKLLDPKLVSMRRAVTKAATQRLSAGERIQMVAKVLSAGLEGQMVVRMPEAGSHPSDMPVITTDSRSTFYIPHGLFTIDDIVMRAADELVRYPNAAKFILGRSMFYSTQPGEYVLEHDELILPEAMLAQEVRELSSAGMMTGIVGPAAALSTNTSLDAEALVDPLPLAPFQLPGRGAPGPGALPSPAAHASPHAPSPKRATPSGCHPLERRPVGPHDKLRKRKLVPPNTVIVTPENRVICIWELLARSLSQAGDRQLSPDDLRMAASRGYRLLSNADATKAAETWRAEGKVAMAKSIREATGPTLAAIAKSPEYYPTNIDLYFLSIAYGLTTVIASSAKTRQTGTEFIVYGNGKTQEEEEQVLLLKRGKQFHNKPMLYNVLASPGVLTMRTISQPLQTVIDANRLSNPYHKPIIRAVFNPERTPADSIQ